MEKRYVVVDMPTGGLSGDMFQYVYQTPEEANAAADYKWHMLTPQERRRRRIMAGVVTKDMLPDDAVCPETGEPDWTMFSDFNDFPGAFGSDPGSNWGRA